MTNPSSFYPSHPKQPFSFRTNSLGGYYNLNFFDIAKAQKYFAHNSSKTHRFNFTSKPPTTANPKTPLSKQNTTSRNFSFSNNNKPACAKPSYLKILNNKKPITPKHHPLKSHNDNIAATSIKNKHLYTPAYKKGNNQRYCRHNNNKTKNKKLTSLSDNNINTNDIGVKECKKYTTIAYSDKEKKVRKDDDVVTADLISAKERRKVILNEEDLKKRKMNGNGEWAVGTDANGKDGDKKRKNVERKIKCANNSNSKKKYLSINTNATINADCHCSCKNKHISKTPKTKPFVLHNMPHNINSSNNNNEHLHTEVICSFNSMTNTLGNQTQTHFKNKYRNLFEMYFSPGASPTTCIPTSHI